MYHYYSMLRTLAKASQLCYNININKGETISSLFIDNCSLTKYQPVNGELDVIVDDVPYQVIDGYYQDPDVQFCEHYGFNYDLVNCIEAM